ncbi:bifunctional diguanylate cyclase/phosphodiesterase [Thalassospira marina]|uniref:Bifunctional diguanylate cyclase/phosphodiesterase n=1 Tax=Thalassospira marina TaxID=2048283 RepID=A0A2N3KN80_9PROT|nr:bifunctional diguanylate cyclase/phosphodiesterase [Thalassospira marina]
MFQPEFRILLRQSRKPVISSRTFLLTRTLPAVLLVLIIGIAGFFLVYWATSEADRVATARQLYLLDQSQSETRRLIPYEQESTTVWDESVVAARAWDTAWLNNNLGSWMHDYYGFADLYVLDPRDIPVLVFREQSGLEAHIDPAFEAILYPMVDRLRQRMRDGEEPADPKSNTLGEIALDMVDGHPSIISVKPIVSDTGKIRQKAGSEFLHVAVQRLDAPEYLSDLERKYLFEHLRFSSVNDAVGAENTYPMITSDGRTIGYFVWQPYRPGSTVMAYISPMLVVLSVGLVMIVFGFMTLMHRRLSSQYATEAKMRHMVMHDSLTGLPNRVHFNQRVDEELEQLDPAGKSGIALLFLDLNGFKQVNDSFGHTLGDKLIYEFGRRLTSLSRERDAVARVGGDEFTLMLTGIRQREDVERFCRRLIELARMPFNIEGQQLFVGLSVGYAFAPEHGCDRNELLRKADVALYHAKMNGRNDFAGFDVEMDVLLRNRRRVETDLREALVSLDQFRVHYQPVYNAVDGVLTGFEALMRWQHPARGWVSPEFFIPVAEESGLIRDIGQYVLQTACEAALKWPAQSIAVNVSIIELQDVDYVKKLAAVLSATGLAPERLELEVTETAVVTAGTCEENLKAIRKMGVKVALDDFGTGFSSLGRLTQIDVDRIKIDKTFIHGFDQSDSDKAMVRAIVELARATRLATTAEGVENVAQVEFLQAIGCDALQGFYFSPAVPADKVPELLAAKPALPTPAARESVNRILGR